MIRSRGTILVVEDKENMRALLRDILTAYHDVTLAADGAIAQGLLQVHAFEVVLTDVRLPKVDGFALASWIKERWPLTEVILMTAYASIPAAVEAMRQGAYDYLQKPFDPDDVSLAVSRALERHRERSSTKSTGAQSRPAELVALSYREAIGVARDRGSREYLSALLKAFSGNVSRAAERAGLERESLHRLLRRYDLHAEDYRGATTGNSHSES